MQLTIREAEPDEIEALIPILLQAEGSEGALRWSLAKLSDVVYRAELGGQLVGAATMQWRDEPCELIELAIAPERHGQGLGKRWSPGWSKRPGGAASASCWWAPPTPASTTSPSTRSVVFAWTIFARTIFGTTASRATKTSRSAICWCLATI